MAERVAEVLVHDHEDLSLLLNGLRLALAKRDVDSCFEQLDRFWARLAMHIRAEHLHLFPAILGAVESCFDAHGPTLAEVNAAIETLREDHNFFMQQLAESIKSFRAALGQKSPPTGAFDSVGDRIKTVANRLDQHNQLEEEKVYQWAALVLSAAELRTLNASLRRELDNLPPRFTTV